MVKFKDFAQSLNDSILGNAGLSENSPSNLDYKNIPFGRLGDFAGRIDKTAQRSYVEDGAIRNIRPRASEILMSEPDLTVVVKKRLFSSLAENYRVDYMDDDDKLFLRASKRLFFNKARVIASYERLTKFERIVSANQGIISDFALPFIFDAVDTITNSPIPQVSSLIDNETRSILDKIRKVKRFSDPQFFTTWNIAEDLPYAVDTGEGTGTFDITIVSSINVTNSVNFGGGSAGLAIEDPYKLMVVTEEEIEQAISEATHLYNRNNFFRLSQSQLQSATDDLKIRLNEIRARRGAAPIFYVIRDNSLLFKRIRAIVDGEGRELDFTFDGGVLGVNFINPSSDSIFVPSSSTEGFNGLRGSQEIRLFKQILNNLYLTLGFEQTTKNQARQYNQRTNYLRKKMMLHYHRKTMIQPMDVVYIYATGKTLSDSKIVQGLKSNYVDNSIVNNIDSLVGGITEGLNNLYSTFAGEGAGSSALVQERNAIAGPEFPLWLYSLMKNDFTRQDNGTSIFVGLCVSASRSYSGGSYTVNISCRDNSHYLNLSQVNINPSVDVFNGSLYDPLTPFEDDFDEASGFLRGNVPQLLDANKRLLRSKSVRAKLGRFRGSGLDEFLFNLPDIENVPTGRGFDSLQSFSRSPRNKFHPPDGFVYRWKEGIGSLVMFGDPHSLQNPALGTMRAETSPNITQNPFAGQDVMNVISLLITGQPYSFNNFVRGAIEFGKIQRKDLTNKNLSASFFKGLIQQVTDQNAIWGNFIPFKKLVLNEEAYQFLAKGQFDLSIRNERLNDLVRERAELFDQIVGFAPSLANSPQNYNTIQGGSIEAGADPADTTPINVLISSLQDLDREIDTLQKDFERSISNVQVQTQEGTLGIFGDDISFDPTIVGLQNQDNESKRREARRELRNRINLLTRRRIWKVRANEDPNLFIVDDTYDKNYDIQAFEQGLNRQLELFNSTYDSPFQKVQQVASIIGLEVFADSQGHINARPPQYNRMPSRVFRDLLQRRAEENIQIFPRYLERLFFTTLQGLTDRIEIIEDEIRLRAAALGRTDDQGVADLLNNSTLSLGTSGTFVFLTNRENGNVNSDIRSLFDQADPDLLEKRNSKALESFASTISSPVNATVNFNVISKINTVQDSQSFTGNVNTINDAISFIADRLEQRTRQKQPTSLQAVLSNNRVINILGRSQADILKVTNEISQFVAERQRIIKRLDSALRNLREGISANDPESNNIDSLLTPNISSSKELPELLEHMIEDENLDDFGFNSGKRFVIEDSQIMNLQIREEPPEANMVQVDGRLANGLAPLPSGLSVGGSGNGVATAWAVDYDTWRMYGWRAANQVTVPFFSNPNTQCAPYAVFLLNLYRKNIFQGECTIVGNEYIQAGEVYYIEDENLLFYANTVNHNYSYGGDFTTSITLKYGHSPGEYIPTHLDVIGKGLYSNRHQAELVRQVRHGRVDDSNHIGTIVFDNRVPISTSADGIRSLVSGTYGEQNRNTLSDMLLTISGILTPSDFGKVLTLEIRHYSNTNPEVNRSFGPQVSLVADAVKNWIIDPSAPSFSNGETLIPVSEDPPQIDPERVSVELVDLNPDIPEETRSPSGLAWSLARSVVSASNIPLNLGVPLSEVTSSNVSEGGQTETESIELSKLERDALVDNIIDIWVVFRNPEQLLQGSKQPTENNQAAQQEENAINNS